MPINDFFDASTGKIKLFPIIIVLGCAIFFSYLGYQSYNGGDKKDDVKEGKLVGDVAIGDVSWSSNRLASRIISEALFKLAKKYPTANKIQLNLSAEGVTDGYGNKSTVQIAPLILSGDDLKECRKYADVDSYSSIAGGSIAVTHLGRNWGVYRNYIMSGR